MIVFMGGGGLWGKEKIDQNVVKRLIIASFCVINSKDFQNSCFTSILIIYLFVCLVWRTRWRCNAQKREGLVENHPGHRGEGGSVRAEGHPKKGYKQEAVRELRLSSFRQVVERPRSES